MKKIIFQNWLLILIVVFSVFIKFVNLDGRYTFDWDQADDATKVMSMVWDKKPLLIGPRVASDNGFFAGPLHYYYLLPFYAVTGGHPIAGAYAVIFVGVLNILLNYYIGNKLYGKKVAYLAALISASSISLTSWNAMFITPIGLLGFYLCQQLLYTNKLFLKTAVLTGFASTIHLVPATMTGYLFFSQIFSVKRASIKQYMIGLTCFLAFFLPIIIFDFRHNFLNFHKIIEFAKGQSTSDIYPNWLYLRSLWRSLVHSGNFNFPYAIIVEKLLIISSFLFAIFKQKDFRSKLLLISWILLPILALSRYHGNIPEYYYGMVTALIPLFIAHFLVSVSLPLSIAIAASLIFVQAKTAMCERVGITLKDKLNVVSYIVNQKNYPVFNVSYDLPFGYETGYSYLFKYLRHEPVSGPDGHLFSISLTSNEKEKFVYKSGILGVIQR